MGFSSTFLKYTLLSFFFLLFFLYNSSKYLGRRAPRVRTPVKHDTKKQEKRLTNIEREQNKVRTKGIFLFQKTWKCTLVTTVRCHFFFSLQGQRKKKQTRAIKGPRGKNKKVSQKETTQRKTQPEIIHLFFLCGSCLPTEGSKKGTFFSSFPFAVASIALAERSPQRSR